MLGKLFAHEWKDTWKLLTLLNGTVLLLTLIGIVIMKTGGEWSETNNVLVIVARSIYIMIYVFAIMALSTCVGLYFWFRFYKNLYTDQGYLMHTLPVTPHELILSKGMVAFLWQLISIFVMMVSFFSLMISVGDVMGFETWADIGEELRQLDMGGKEIYMVVVMLLFCLVSVIASLLMGYTSVSIGQLFKKHRLGAAVGVYMGLQMALQTVVSTVNISFTLSASKLERMSEQDTVTMMGNMFLLYLLVEIAICGLMYFINYYIMKNKLNLE